MGKWVDILELFLKPDTEISSKEIQLISQFLQKWNSAKAMDPEPLLQKKEETIRAQEACQKALEAGTKSQPQKSAKI
jgi:hypothetical protein